MDQMRQALVAKEKEQIEEFHRQNVLLTAKKLDLIAGSRHHWLGTNAVPGVFARVHTAAAIEQIELLDSKGKANPATQIPESKLKSNDSLRKWFKTHIGRNIKAVKIRPPVTPELKPEEKVKAAQGPFLVSTGCSVIDSEDVTTHTWPLS